jgi:hypothetical protein
MEDQHEVEFEEYEESWTGRIVIAAVVALALIGGAFFAGRAMAGDSGPATLAEAVTQAQSGDLPCGGGAGFMLRAICQPDATQGQGQGQARGRFGGGGGFGQTGQVSAVSADSLTLTGPMGQTTVKLDGKTTINKSSKSELGNIKTGDSVLVSGARPNSNSAATSVTILPQTSAN